MAAEPARLRVMTVIGTRPEAIKMAPVVRALEAEGGVAHRLCVTAQHRAMLDQVLHLFDLQVHEDLDLMRPDQQLAELTARAVVEVHRVVARERPDWVLVQGDTTTAMAAALAAFYAGVKVGHVEAGLRSFDKRQPFPEEVNRRIAGIIADAHFAPTNRSKGNLLREGVPADTIVVTGNTVIDAVLAMARRPFDPRGTVLAQVPEDGRLVLVTCHRRENFGPPLQEIFGAILDLARCFPDLHFVYPVHPNPNVRDVARAYLGTCPAVTLTEPLEYLPLVHLLQRSTLVLTDSGGLQEEAPGFGKPVLVMREVTERPEGVDAGTVRLVGASRTRITAEASRLLSDPVAYRVMASRTNPYGDGNAAARIVDWLLGRPVMPFAPVPPTDGGPAT